MKTIGLIANCRKPSAAAVVRSIARRAREVGLAVLADAPTLALLGRARGVGLLRIRSSRADAVVALGGDGTVLRVVRMLAGRDVPIMGVNIGGLGFLTSVSEEEVGDALECLAADRYSVSSRTRIECGVWRGGQSVGVRRALNEVLIRNGASSRVIRLDVAVNNEPVASYVCDGVLISTPTGSTGHSLSAGGPIVEPTSPVFAIVTLCPHTLSSRPLVVPDEASIEVRIPEAEGEAPRLTLDGQSGMPLRGGDRVELRKSRSPVRFVHLPDHNYFRVLAAKLHWSGSSSPRGATRLGARREDVGRDEKCRR